LGPPLGAVAVRALARTLSIERDERTVAPLWHAGTPVIYAVWHGRILLLPHLYGWRRPCVLASRSRDGDLLVRFVRRFGLDSVRGSSTRGGAEALRLLVRSLKHGHDVAVVPDGPTGPAEHVKPGIVALARWTGAALAPLAVGTSSEWSVRSWDRFRIPRPFARCVVRFGEPIFVERLAGRDRDEAARRELESALQALSASVDRDARS
jgi:lysophospholipid acyltransferase (LPLAT)-like uncharacterized protein